MLSVVRPKPTLTVGLTGARAFLSRILVQPVVTFAVSTQEKDRYPSELASE